MKKRKITDEERALLTDMLARNLPASSIAKRLKMKNSTLQRVCEAEGLPTAKRHVHPYIKTGVSGFFVFGEDRIPFTNLHELFVVMKYSTMPGVRKIEVKTNCVKVHMQGNEMHVIDPTLSTDKPTIEMIAAFAGRGQLVFASDYFNKRFNIQEARR